MIKRERLKEKLYTKMLKHTYIETFIRSPKDPMEAKWLSQEAIHENQLKPLMAMDCCAEMFGRESRGIFIIM